MIETIAIALLAFLFAMTGMAVGLLVRRQEMARGCMALGTAGIKASTCQVCGRPADGNGCAGTAAQAPPEESST